MSDRLASLSGAVAGFLGAAVAAAGVVPGVLYEWSQFYQAVAIVVLGLLGTPLGGLVGVTLANRLKILRAQSVAGGPPD